MLDQVRLFIVNSFTTTDIVSRVGHYFKTYKRRAYKREIQQEYSAVLAVGGREELLNKTHAITYTAWGAVVTSPSRQE
jgi:hypothetical protein